MHCWSFGRRRKLLNSYALGSESILQLVVDGSTVYALAYNSASAATRPAVTFSPGLALTPIGAGTSRCFALAGPAAIDHAHNTLVALTRSTTGAGAFHPRLFIGRRQRCHGQLQAGDGSF